MKRWCVVGWAGSCEDPALLAMDTLAAQEADGDPGQGPTRSRCASRDGFDLAGSLITEGGPVARVGATFWVLETPVPGVQEARVAVVGYGVLSGSGPDQLNTGWCTPGVHGLEISGANRTQRESGFTLRTAVLA